MMREYSSVSNVVAAVAFSGLLAGSLDVFAAAAINSVSPVIVLKAIAAGLFGPQAFKGGTSVAVAGLLLQWTMSVAIAAIFWLAALRIGWLNEHRLIAGGSFGIGVYIVMNFVVVPLSKATSHLVLTPRGVAPDLIAMILFGLIIAYVPRFLPEPYRL